MTLFLRTLYLYSSNFDLGETTKKGEPSESEGQEHGKSTIRSQLGILRYYVVRQDINVSASASSGALSRTTILRIVYSGTSCIFPKVRFRNSEYEHIHDILLSA